MAESDVAREQIREFVTPIAERHGVRSYTDRESLTEAGVLNSLSLFRIVTFLEETFPISINDDEIVMENFDSIDRIYQLVASKLADDAAGLSYSRPLSNCLALLTGVTSIFAPY